MFRIPSFARLAMWGCMLVMVVVLLVWDPPKPTAVAPADKTSSETNTAIQPPQRVGSDSELQQSIVELGAQKLAKRIYLLDGQHRFSGILIWWHDGHQERLCYLAGDKENWSTAVSALPRALNGSVYALNLPGDGDISQRLPDLPLPSDRLPTGWTILLRHGPSTANATSLTNPSNATNATHSKNAQ